ncbi:alanine/glycine:cation symporter family protein [Enterococcus xiangfangensis]|uniref:alanine/glycine:cation symporter family protein n=1 Tax=Enterococcus xiangfangensis TaxID=1296537 RepID=UPI0010FA2C57|nr:sodium:alanine symporter family protein [Enterococcus xiangfangensis]MBM7711302.1 AGCS family alanine or glycine:cation symporter [Enterococcus xiangfangensis]NBK09059.1 sodium:alanine symporter family protein [Enterococcus asini]
MEIINALRDFLWDYIIIALLCFAGVFFSIQTRFVQFRKLKESFKLTFGNISLRGNKAGDEGMTSFQSLMTSIAAQIGTGNLAGVATAMVMGGPGSVFWMWLSALMGMAIIYAEATLSQIYRTRKGNEIVGGPVYYIRAAFSGMVGKYAAALFSVLLILALGFMGNMVQANSVGQAMEAAFNIPPLVTGVVLGLASLYVFIGGTERVAAVTEKIVPLMAVFFALVSIIVVIINFAMIPEAIREIFVGAFKPEAVMGGILGVGVKESIRFGIARGLFTHEAGMGSTPHAHALARVSHPAKQGLVAMMGVFIDTIILLPMTVFVILTSGSLGTTKNGVFLDGIELTQHAYSQTLGSFGYPFIAICVTLFAYATLIGWYFFGEANVKYLFGKKAVPIYAVLVAIFIAIGSGLKVELVWSMADLFNGLMIIPNIIAIFALYKKIVIATKEYELSSK